MYHRNKFVSWFELVFLFIKFALYADCYVLYNSKVLLSLDECWSCSIDGWRINLSVRISLQLSYKRSYKIRIDSKSSNSSKLGALIIFLFSGILILFLSSGHEWIWYLHSFSFEMCLIYIHHFSIFDFILSYYNGGDNSRSYHYNRISSNNNHCKLILKVWKTEK